MADHATFIDNDISSTNRVSAGWLNGVGAGVYQGANAAFGTSSGAANTYTLTLPATSYLTSLSAGHTFTFKAHQTNTGSATFTVVGGASLGPYTIKQASGALTGNEIVVGAIVQVTYDGTAMQLQSASSPLPVERMLNAVTYGGLDNTGATSVTSAFNTLIAYAAAQGIYEIYFPPGTYKFSTAPAAVGRVCLYGSKTIVGPATTLLRSYTPSSGAAFLNVQNAEFALRYMQLWADGGTSDGYAISVVPGATDSYDYGRLEDVLISGDGTWEKAINMDGSARVGAGVRDWTLDNVRCYQAISKVAHFKSVVSLTVTGGGFFETGGIPTHDIHVDGTAATPSTTVNISTEYCGKLEVTRCNPGIIEAPNLATITIDANSTVRIHGGSTPTITNASGTSTVHYGATFTQPTGTWTPTANGFTVVGTPTYSGYWRRINANLIYWRITAHSTTSVASTAGVSTFTAFPFTVIGSNAFFCSSVGVASATGWMDTTAGGTAQVGTIAASTDLFCSGIAEV